MPRVAHDGALNIFHNSTQQVRRITLSDRFVVNAYATSGADVLIDAKVRVFFFSVCLPASWHTRNIGIPLCEPPLRDSWGSGNSKRERRTDVCSNFTSVSAKRLHNPRGEPRFLGDEVATGRQLQRQGCHD